MVKKSSRNVKKNIFFPLEPMLIQMIQNQTHGLEADYIIYRRGAGW